MDVILDSNQYWDDPRMEKDKFQALFDHLRITGGALVVPRVVRDEVLFRCEDEMRKEHSRAVTSLKNLGKRVFKLKVPKVEKVEKDLADPDYAEEKRLLDEKLATPAPGVKSIVLPDYSDVDVAEVAKRGIQRIKPASGGGEQLRDVMVWLAVVAYTKKRGEKVGFVSGDTGFQVEKEDKAGKEDKRLHPDLKEELAAHGIEVVFAATIDDFVKDQTPKRKTVDADWVQGHLTADQIGDIKQLFKYGIANLLQGSILSATPEPTVLFKSGTIYEVSEESQFVELEYEGSWDLTIGSTESKFEMPFLYNVASPTLSAGQVPPFFIEETRRGRYDAAALGGVARPATIPSWQAPINPFGKALGDLASTNKAISLSAAFPVSFRVLKGVVGRPETDLRRFREIGSQHQEEQGG